MTRSRVQATVACVTQSLLSAKAETRPYAHLLMTDVLPRDVAAAVTGLPFRPAAIGDTLGKRDSHNESRIFFSGETLDRHPITRVVAEAFQSREVVDAIAQATGARLDGTRVRVEYTQDTGNFYLHPHSDVGPKQVTVLCYLSDSPEADALLGTDIYDDDKTWVARAPGGYRKGLAFVPLADTTLHGFEKRSWKGVRKSLIINYVTGEWRSGNELAFPDTPVHVSRKARAAA
jgi:hypothetical protein